MLFSSALVSTFLLTSAVLADLPRENYRAGLLNRLEGPPINASDKVIYSKNWAGIVWAKDNGTFNSIEGTFTIPDVSGQSGSGASFWVGIDGHTCKSAILQTGVTGYINGTETLYFAWHEWFPASTEIWSDFSVSAGDVVRANVTAFSLTSGIAIIENLTTGQSQSVYLNSTHPLCGQNAEWIVEDYLLGDEQVPFPNFSTVTFTDAVATGLDGTFLTPEGGLIVDIRENGQVLTSVSVNASSFAVQYV